MFARLRRLPIRTKNKVSVTVALVCTIFIAVGYFFLITPKTPVTTPSNVNVSQGINESKNIFRILSERAKIEWARGQEIFQLQK